MIEPKLKEIIQIMKTIFLQIDERILEETEEILSQIKTSRNKYISEALNSYNKKQKQENLRRQLKKESELVRKESISVLKEFEEIDY